MTRGLVNLGGLLVAVLCLAVSAAPAPADVGIATVQGRVTDASTKGGIATATVTAVSATGARYSAATDAGGDYRLDGLPAPESYVFAFSAPGYSQYTTPSTHVDPGWAPAIDAQLSPLPAALTGMVRDASGAPLYGMQVLARGGPVANATYLAFTGPDGRYTMPDLQSGTYAVAVRDAGGEIPEGTVTLSNGATTTASFELPPPAVPAGTAARLSARDVGYLNAERAAVGLPAGIVLNSRWSTECAAHDAYMYANHVLEHPESAARPGASPGGAWAGTTAVLSEGAAWSRRATPWERAPIHLNQLFAPSLSVIGIDDSHGYICATTWPGMLRTPPAGDTIYTYPADGARGFATRERAAELPFTPSQVVGIPARKATGREMFVYLNRAGQTGQAPVRIVRTTLFDAHRKVKLRWVDSFSPKIGPFLAGGILIPSHPLRAGTWYSASVTVRDGTRKLVHRWTFRTAGGPGGHRRAHHGRHQ